LHGGGDFVLDLFMAVRSGSEIHARELTAGGEDWVSSLAAPDPASGEMGRWYEVDESEEGQVSMGERG
jgi:hypothetical protein